MVYSREAYMGGIHLRREKRPLRRGEASLRREERPLRREETSLGEERPLRRVFLP